MTAIGGEGLRDRLRRVALRIAGVVGADVSACLVPALLVMPPTSTDGIARLAGEFVRNDLVFGVLLTLAIEVHEDVGPSASAGRASIGLWSSVALAVVVGSWLASADRALEFGLAATSASLKLYTTWKFAIIGSIATAYLTRRKESFRAEEGRRVQETRLRQARRRLATVAAQTERSRLDPQMLLDCLVRARDVYATDRDGGDALLERLTHYLRATLAGSARNGCTLGQEAAIAAARVGIEQRDGRATVTVEIPPALAPTPFPPELLSTVAHDWLAQARTAPASLALAAVETARALRVTLVGPCAVPDPVRRHCEEALATFTSCRGTVRCDGARLHLEFGDAQR